MPQVSLVLRDLGLATSAASVIGIAIFLRHFGSRVVDVLLAQVSQQRRDLGHPADYTPVGDGTPIKINFGPVNW